MNNSVTKITSVEAICLIVIITINRIILNLPQNILKSCGSSSILNVIYVSILAIIFTIIIVKLYSYFSGSDIIDISEFLGGKPLKIIINIILILYLIYVAGILLRNFNEVIYIIAYEKTPIVFLILFFIITSIISNFLGESAVIKTNTIITFIMLLSLIATFISVIPNIEIERIYPILGYGGKDTFFNGISNIFSFNGLICIYLIAPMLKEKNNYKVVTIVSTIIISLLLILSVASLLLSIPFTSTTKGISPIYMLIKNNEFGNFVQNPESVFVFTWILSMMTYLNVVLMFIIKFFKKLTNIKSKKIFIIPISIIIFIIAILQKNILSTHSSEEVLYKYIAFPIAFILFPTILILAYIKYRKKHLTTIKFEEENKKDLKEIEKKDKNVRGNLYE